MLNVKISGINGYLGALIANALRQGGHSVEGISRQHLYGSVDDLVNEIRSCDLIIHLAGAPLLQRWSKTARQTIYSSRVTTTHNLVQAVHRLDPEERPLKFISASAIGIYKSGQLHDENSTDFNTDFAGTVVQDWERQLNHLPAGIQKVIFRIAPVLGKKSQLISRMRLPFRLGLGAAIGNGSQAFPFIHEVDLVRAFYRAAVHDTADGTFNLVAPQQISNLEFTKTLARLLRRPAFLHVPGFVLRLVYGRAAGILLESPAVKPNKLIEAGFEFRFPDIETTLSDILAE